MAPKPKSSKSQKTKSATTDKSSTDFGESFETSITPRQVILRVTLEGSPPGPGEWTFVAVFKRNIVLDGKWNKDAELEPITLPLDLKDPRHQEMITTAPVIFLIRAASGKGNKDPDPLLHSDNRAGAAVDLFPLLIGEERVNVRVRLININTGQPTECIVNVNAVANEPSEQDNDDTIVPLVITMISAHCLPVARDGTFYIAAIGLDNVIQQSVVFGMSLSFADAKKTVWASASNAGQAANTAYSIPNEDRFIPDDLALKDTQRCRSIYWNATNRVRVDPNLLRERLTSPLALDFAGVPRLGKAEIRGHYMAFVDAGVLLQPGQYGVTVCAKLLFYNDVAMPTGAILELPPASAKAYSARESDSVLDEYEHNAYIVIRFDLCEPLIPKTKMAVLFGNIGLTPPDGPAAPIDQLDVDNVPEDNTVDVRKIRKESGALAVHKELSGLACRGAVPMNQGIKRTAANRLLMRVRSMLKQFPPGECSKVEWQDTVTAQHAASRRAVTSSFAPQPPPDHPPPRVAAARCRMAGDHKTGNAYNKANLKRLAGNPRALLYAAMRSLEERKSADAKNFILEGLSAHQRNRFLLWIYGGLEFDKGDEASSVAGAAFRVAVKGNYSDGTGNAIGWGALHTLYHFNKNPHGAFIAAKKMRKSYELPREWTSFLQRWIEESGEEEFFWNPASVSQNNPLLITAAFFLCLRCFEFSDMILKCVENGCGTNGSRFGSKSKMCPDNYYVRAASLVLQRQYDDALKVTTEGVQMFGPNPLMSQMRATCLSCTGGWDGNCEIALGCAEKSGAAPSPTLLLRAALGGINTNPEVALQRAARAHQIAPSGHSALIIGRVYAKLNEIGLAERWAAAAVKLEPWLADGWAVLALLGIYQKNMDKTRIMLRTAKQLGAFSPEIEEELKKTMDAVKLEGLPESLVKNLCLCDYY